jgi:hypothetical protein
MSELGWNDVEGGQQGTLQLLLFFLDLHDMTFCRGWRIRVFRKYCRHKGYKICQTKRYVQESSPSIYTSLAAGGERPKVMCSTCTILKVPSASRLPARDAVSVVL